MRALSLLLLLPVACQQPAPEPEPPSTPAPVGTGSGDYHAEVLEQTTEAGRALAAGAEWSAEVRISPRPMSTVFEYEVRREDAEQLPDETFTGTVEVPNGRATTRTFPLDEAGEHPAYRLTFTGGR